MLDPIQAIGRTLCEAFAAFVTRDGRARVGWRSVGGRCRVGGGGGVSKSFCVTWILRRKLMKNDETKGTSHYTARFLRNFALTKRALRARSRGKILPSKVNIFNTL